MKKFTTQEAESFTATEAETLIKNELKKANFIYQIAKLQPECRCEGVCDYILHNEMEIINNEWQLKNIKALNRENYKHQGDHINLNILKETMRLEENIAKSLFFAKTNSTLTNLPLTNDFGELDDYQVPLKTKRDDKGYGKIDMVYKSNDTLSLIELKRPQSDETLMKAVLEIQTYYQQFNKETFLKSFDCLGYKIKKVVMIFKNSQADKQWKKINKYPKLQELINKFNIKIYVLKKEHQVENILINHLKNQNASESYINYCKREFEYLNEDND